MFLIQKNLSAWQSSLLKIDLLEDQSCMKWACMFLTVEMCCVELFLLFIDVHAFLLQRNFMAQIMVLFQCKISLSLNVEFLDFSFVLFKEAMLVCVEEQKHLV